MLAVVARSSRTTRISSGWKPHSWRTELIRKTSLTQPSKRFAGFGYALIPIRRARRWGRAAKSRMVRKLRANPRAGRALDTSGHTRVWVVAWLKYQSGSWLRMSFGLSNSVRTSVKCGPSRRIRAVNTWSSRLYRWYHIRASSGSIRPAKQSRTNGLPICDPNVRKILPARVPGWRRKVS